MKAIPEADNSTRAECSVCAIDGEQTLATNHYYPNIDKPEKVYVCDGHVATIERKGFVVFNDNTPAESEPVG